MKGSGFVWKEICFKTLTFDAKVTWFRFKEDRDVCQCACVGMNEKGMISVMVT